MKTSCAPTRGKARECFSFQRPWHGLSCGQRDGVAHFCVCVCCGVRVSRTPVYSKSDAIR